MIDTLADKEDLWEKYLKAEEDALEALRAITNFDEHLPRAFAARQIAQEAQKAWEISRSDKVTDAWKLYLAANSKKFFAQQNLIFAQDVTKEAEKALNDAQNQAFKAWETWSIAKGPR